MTRLFDSFKERLAQYVVVTGSIVAGVCAVAAILASAFGDPETADISKDILTIILPVLGTWIGTVLAFYFGRENYEAAARETRLSLKGRLGRPAREFAIPVERIESIDVKDRSALSALPLSEITDFFDRTGFFRVVIFLKDGKKAPPIALAVVHRQPVDSFIAARARAKEAIDGLTYADLAASPEGDRIADGFRVIRADGTLSDVKVALESSAHRQDVFLTSGGTAGEPVLGWITNNELQRASEA